ncbi:MAG: hypothetical protein E7463_10755, partial [Ruminococcaceae bacterium]|nr:hypothetical protein [Oscillospiraceae bacterium]
MSIPAGRTSWFGRYEDREKWRLINQHGIRFIADPAGTGYSSCWDMNVSPFDGTVYVSLCHEVGKGDHSRLVAYNYDEDRAWIASKTEDVTLPRERALPHTKHHESLSFLPDGQLIMTTHSTDRARHHPDWMPFAHTTHVWEGFPGSYILRFDPKTGETFNLGMPAPRESIYGATYNKKDNCFYMIGFMRGHVYRYSLDDKTVMDLGKAAELYCYRLHAAPDGHVYGMTKTGFLFRVNTDKIELEDMNWRAPAHPDNFINNTWYRYMVQAHDISDHEFVFSPGRGEDMYVFDCNTQTVRSLGKCTPYDYVNDFECSSVSYNEFAVDKYGVLWYAVNGWKIDKPQDEFFRAPNPRMLIRWDIKNGGSPECLGIIGTQEVWLQGATGLCLDKERDRLFIIGGVKCVEGKSPDFMPAEGAQSIFCLDLAQFRAHMDEKGPIWDEPIKVIPYSDEEIAAIRKAASEPPVWAGEEVSGKNPFTAFPLGNVIPIRLWREVPDVIDSKVQGLCWDEEGNVHGVCGVNTKYYFKLVPRGGEYFASKEEADCDQNVMVWRTILKARIHEGERDGKYFVEAPMSFSYKVAELKPYDNITVGLDRWLQANLLPGAVDIDENIKLPEVVGRRYLAVATATAKMSDDRIAVGTKDGLFAIVKDGKAFSYGNAAAQGPVRCMCV